jgi:hypothetical protein
VVHQETRRLRQHHDPTWSLTVNGSELLDWSTPVGDLEVSARQITRHGAVFIWGAYQQSALQAVGGLLTDDGWDGEQRRIELNGELLRETHHCPSIAQRLPQVKI